MHVSGLRGSLEPTMDRKRQLHRIITREALASLELIDDFIEMISSSHLNDQSALSERSNHD